MPLKKQHWYFSFPYQEIFNYYGSNLAFHWVFLSTMCYWKWVIHSRFSTPQTVYLFLLCVLVGLKWCWHLSAVLVALTMVLKHATEKLPGVCISNRHNITLSIPCFFTLRLLAVNGTNQDKKSCLFSTLLTKYKLHGLVSCLLLRAFCLHICKTYIASNLSSEDVMLEMRYTVNQQ